MNKTITYRAWGVDFVGDSESLEALDAAKLYAEHGVTQGWGDTCSVFLVAGGGHQLCPVEITTYTREGATQ